MITFLILLLLILALGGGAFIYHPLFVILALAFILWLVSVPVEGGRWYGRRWR